MLECLLIKKEFHLPISEMVQKEKMPMLKCGFCALSEGSLSLSSLELACVTPFLLCLHLFHIPTIIQTVFWCIQNRCCFQAGSWPSIRRVVRETVPVQTFLWHLCRTDCRLQCRHPFLCAWETGCCTEHHLCCMRMASSLEIIKVHRLCSASRHPLCWVLNMQSPAQVACKSKWWDWENTREETEVKWNHLSLNSSSVANWDPRICF